MAGTFYDDEVEVRVGRTHYDVAYLFDTSLMGNKRSSVTTACKKCRAEIIGPYELVWIHRQTTEKDDINPKSDLGRKILAAFRKHLQIIFSESHHCTTCAPTLSSEI